LEPIDRSLGIIPFGRISLKLASAHFAMGSFAHNVTLLAAAKRATIDSSSNRLAINIGDLIGAVNRVGLAEVDTTDVVLALSRLSSRQTGASRSLRLQSTSRLDCSTGVTLP
jgi:hypothetical protein